MTERKKWLGIAGSLMLSTTLVAACSNAPNSEGSSSPNNSETNPPAEETANFNATGMPIVNEQIELTFFTGLAATNGSTPFEERLAYKEMEAMSNIKVNFQFVPFDGLTEKRNLALANGDYPDAFFTARIPAADLMRYGAEGVFVQLDGGLLENYAPNLTALMEKYPDLRKALTMPDGHIYSMPSFYDPEFLPMLIGTPLWIKEDWLKQLGMEEPTTIEEYYNFLKAVKTTDLNGNGQLDEIPYSGTGIASFFDQIKGAWGLGTRGLGHKHVDVDPETNELRFFRTSDRYKEMLEFVHQLYAEGLIDKDIFTQDSKALFAKGSQDLLASTINSNPITQFNGEGYIGLGALKGPHGDQLYSNIKVPMVWVGAFAITDKNPHPEATVRWMDHFFSEEGAIQFFMGKEGESYTVNDDGSLEFMDHIKNNPDGLTLDQALTSYVSWMGGSYPGYVHQKWFKGSETLPSSVEAGEKAAPYQVEELWYNFNFTQEETEFMSTIGSDIHSYITEMEAKFVNGSAPFSEWEKYVQTVHSMGVDRYLEVYQAALERYNQN
ncbi:extracellular solute-binding protein [Paenibacillus senegalensis]|uniref:extracellular solute-binding protein n=1 Tax=Paenibacillus senegalensis TaxID=1465766 RepID=UPI000287D2A3|nr:extracellular solute-binding protein [Paenibacillus senegalensis]